MVWGGRRLADFLGAALEPGQSYGEAWMVSDHPLHLSVVGAGSLAGHTLRQLLEEKRPELLGQAAAQYDRFPWLIKFLDCQDWLSVQVHPDEQAVKKLSPGEGSKTEAWFVLDAASGSKIYAGLRPGVDEARLRSALKAGTVAECLHCFEPRPGDSVFLPAGTVHAVGGGVLLSEIQQTSDATFRLFDWNRRDKQGKARPLHIEQAIASIHWDRGPVEPLHVPGFKTGSGATPSSGRKRLVTCPDFTMDYVRTGQPFACGGEGRLQALVVVQGRARWSSAECQEEIKTGQVWVLPASLPRISCQPQPDLAALLCTLP
jgi:mannose-6-phosphate isomerase